MSLLLMFNAQFQYFSPKPTADFSNPDIHANLFMANPAAYDEKAIIGENYFYTYGPLFQYFYSGVGPYGSQLSYGFIVFLLLLYSIFFIAYSNRSEFKYSFLIWPLFFGLFNFPSFFASPFIIFLFAITFPKECNGHLWEKILIFCAFLYFVLSFLFKPSWGIAVGLQFTALVLFHPYFSNIRTKTIFTTAPILFILSYISFGIFSNFNLSNFLKYFSIAIEDSSQYSTLLSYPYDGRQQLIYYYPWLILGILACLSFFRIHGKKGWLALMMFPILLVDFKHAYVRADYTNIYYIFWSFPLVLFFTLIRFWDHKGLRSFIILLLSVATLLDFFQFTPGNIPWRHPRHLWLKSPHQVAELQIQHQQSTQKVWEDYQTDFNWVKDSIQDQSFISIPFQAGLTHLSKKGFFLPGLQPYFGYGNSQRVKTDTEFFKLNQPEFILMQDECVDKRSPMDCRKEMYLNMFEKYQLFDQRLPYTLWKRKHEDHFLDAKQVNLEDFLIENLPHQLNFNASEGSLLELKLIDQLPFQNLKKSLGKGDLLIFELDCEGVKRTFQASLNLLQHGILFKLNFHEPFNSEKTKEYRLKFLGTSLQNSTLDPFQNLYDFSNMRMNLSEWVFNKQ